jgi:hypothetical protein
MERTLKKINKKPIIRSVFPFLETLRYEKLQRRKEKSPRNLMSHHQSSVAFILIIDHFFDSVLAPVPLVVRLLREYVLGLPTSRNSMIALSPLGIWPLIRSNFIKTTYDISLDSQIYFLPLGFSPSATVFSGIISLLKVDGRQVLRDLVC